MRISSEAIPNSLDAQLSGYLMTQGPCPKRFRGKHQEISSSSKSKPRISRAKFAFRDVFDPAIDRIRFLAYTMVMGETIKGVEGVCVGGCVRKLNRMVTAIYDGALAGAGVKTSQFSVLVAVANRGKARPAELTELLQMDESTLSRNVERMCARGWLRLERNEDRRSHLIEVTDKGQTLIRKCLPSWRQAQAEVSKRLGTGTVAELRSALRKLSA
jgi:DNA-binding MarR family transcriptional regulator